MTLHITVRNVTNVKPGVDMFESKLWFACRCRKDSRMNQHKIEWLGLLSWRSLSIESIVSNHSQLPRRRHFGDIYSCPCCGRSLRAVTHHLSAERNERNDSQVGSLVPFLHRSHMRCVGNEGMEDLSCSSWLIQHKSTSVLVHTRVCYWGIRGQVNEVSRLIKLVHTQTEVFKDVHGLSLPYDF